MKTLAGYVLTRDALHKNRLCGGTRRYCVETVKHIITLFSPFGSHKTSNITAITSALEALFATMRYINWHWHWFTFTILGREGLSIACKAFLPTGRTYGYVRAVRTGDRYALAVPTYVRVRKLPKTTPVLHPPPLPSLPLEIGPLNPARGSGGALFPLTLTPDLVRK